MTKFITSILASLALASSALVAPHAMAGGGGELTAADDYVYQLNYIHMAEAEQLLGQEDVHFFDANTLEIRAQGYIPGSVHIYEVDNWRDRLPEKKDDLIIVYCANRLCNTSEVMAYQIMQMGYTHVWQMPDGIFGWRMAGRPFELP